MIITRQSARNMNKDTLANLASDYATEFAHLLDHEGEVRIKPEEVVYKKREAKKLFLKKFKPSDFSSSIREFIKFRYDDLNDGIDRGKAFVQNGVAFIPLLDISAEESRLVNRLQPSNPKNSDLYERLLALFSDRNPDYCSLSGFGSEVAHLTGDKLYNNRVQGGLGEALDVGSQFLEMSKNIRFLSKQSDKQEDIEKVIDEYSKQFVSDSRDEIELYETLLFKGETSAKQKIIEFKKCKSEKNIDRILGLLKFQYVMAAHYDGIKLFLEVFDSVEGDFPATYRRLGNVLANPKVTDMETALTELGYTSESLLKYQGVFGKGIIERAKRLFSSSEKK